jgi:RHS repeat-associated protein
LVMLARSWVRLLVVAVALLTARTRILQAQIGVSFDPSGGSYTTGSQVSVTIKFCASPEQYYLSHWITFNGQDYTGSFSEGGGYDPNCAFQQTWNGTITINEGTNNTLAAGFTAYYFDGADVYWETSHSGSASYTGIAPPPPTVTAGAGSVVPSPATGVKGTFRVTANYDGTHTLSVSCTGVASSCTVSPTSVSLSAGAWSDVEVTYSVSGAPLATGQITVTASNVTSGQATQSVRVAPRSPVIARGECLTVAIGPSAAFECGDLRIVHPLPSVRTLGRVRTPTLVYNSQHARPRPVVTTEVTLNTAADSVVATLVVGGQAAQSRSWSQLPVGSRRVGVAYDPGSALRTNLYAYTLEVKRYNGGSPSTIATVADTLAIVNRDSSAFGAGWWLAGFEQLVFPQAGGILWVGGDGSVRRYVSVASNTYIAAPVDHPDTLLYRPSDTTYVRILPGGDSVVFNASGFHIRTANRLGYRTEFVPDGSNRLWQIKIPPQMDSLVYTFTYGSSTSRLSQVTAPDTAGGSGRLTLFGTSDIRITSIQDPSSSGSVVFGYGSGADIRRMASRSDRRGATTFFEYDDAARLRASKLGLSSAANDTIRRTFTAIAETRGLATQDAAAPHPDSVFTRFDGPRTGSDSVDVITFWVAAHGGVRQVRDPYGYVTTVTRGDPRWPVLPTRTQAPNGRVMSAAYDARGNLAMVADSNPYDNGQHPTTRYQWHQRWDELTLITMPNGQLTRFGITEANGNRTYVEDGGGSIRRTTFEYYGTGNNRTGLVRAVVAPGGARDSVDYSVLGNVNMSRSPLEWRTLSVHDRLGRTRVTRSPLGPAASDTIYRNDSTAYTAMGLVLRQTSYGPARGSAPAQTLIATNAYDDDGRPRAVTRTAVGASFGALTTSWTYDNAGRPIVETAPDGAVDSTFYDVAGNIIRVRNRRQLNVAMVYDRLNRLRRRTSDSVTYASVTRGIDTIQGAAYPYPWYPNDPQGGYTIAASVDSFAYDSVGNDALADNDFARVRRRFYKNGQLRTDSVWTRSIAGSNWTQHVYGMAYTYDVNGRMIALRSPAQLARNSATVADSARYVYNAVTGALDSVIDLQKNAFSFLYSNRGELVRTRMPGNVYDSLAFDNDGRLVANRVRHTNNTQTQYYFPNSIIRDATYDYADPARVYRAMNYAGWRDTTRSTYSGLGYLDSLIYSRWHYSQPWGTDERRFNTERFVRDALANTTGSQTRSDLSVGTSYTSANPIPRTMYLDSVGRLRVTVDPNYRSDSVLYNAAGDQEFVHSVKDWSPINSTVWYENRATYYDAGGRARAAEWRRAKWARGSGPGSVPEGNGTWMMAFEEFRYDALGRRVLVRVRRSSNFLGAPMDPIPENIHLVRRTVWAGERELWEIQTIAWPQDSVSGYWENDTLSLYIAPAMPPNSYIWFDPSPLFGRVGYTYGPALDEPLSITKFGHADFSAGNPLQGHPFQPFTVVPHWNGRGRPDYGLFADGQYRRVDGGRFALTRWQHGVFALSQEEGVLSQMVAEQSYPVTYAWLGTLVQDKEDETWTRYRRNRYLDPLTGQFTQEDPIGLAGGLNLYGFAGGDPINFSDPFGLCPGLPGCPDTGAITSTAFDPLALFGGLIAGGIKAIGARWAARTFLRGAAADATAVSAAQGAATVAGSLVDDVAAATGGTVRALARGQGSRITVSTGGRNVVARIKPNGDYRVSIEGLSSLTREGVMSSDAALTHLTGATADDVIRLVNQATQIVKAAKQ